MAKQKLEGLARTMVDHFFENAPYGNPKMCKPSTTLLAWPHVRHLVWDQLRPEFGQGEPRFSNITYKDRFLQELVDEAKKIKGLLPKEISNKDWRYVVGRAYGLLMSEEYISRGLVDEKGQASLQMRSFAGQFQSKSGDQYEDAWEQFRKRFGKKKIA